MSKELSIYVHTPFCERKCLYCDFLSFSAEKGQMELYFEALGKEIQATSKEYEGYVVKSIFFGGGTPSFPAGKLICDTLELIRENFEIGENCEISIEANPASAIFEKLVAYRRAGFNRLSIGAQSLNDAELSKLGRLHDSRMLYETFEDARLAGFENINVDVMSALPDQDLQSYMGSLRKVVELAPEHISAYSLIIEEGTPFYDMDLNLPDEEADRQMYHETKKYLAERGYHRYEISNYARSLGNSDGESVADESDATYESIHNKVYWKRGNYLGLGLGASSMVENVRWNNIRDIREYVETMDGGDLKQLRENIEELSIESQMEEFMFLGLRLVKGVSTDDFKKLFGREIHEVYGEVIDKYLNSGHLVYDNGRLRLTEEGLDVSNTIMAEFLF
ncbi:radical SAM family heme chaperone HemW [Butyrivibrio sp. CB08]|uniref:radical SAM family heme chaperone HemW n=1 Tax=Butyrivibrio sp. CB08 TaxID=2364879 RepID=UPI000EA9F62F|nr:radical SAM family heme chaperone HemW [Butyrivibrio sp. CB08]RKM61295.1 radical SAM family heme chaperone HemW [Butyrivibrio sp. CB08]